MQVLMTAINLDSINNVLSANGILNGFVGSTQMILLGVISILFSVSIAFDSSMPAVSCEGTSVRGHGHHERRLHG